MLETVSAHRDMQASISSSSPAPDLLAKVVDGLAEGLERDWLQVHIIEFARPPFFLGKGRGVVVVPKTHAHITWRQLQALEGSGMSESRNSELSVQSLLPRLENMKFFFGLPHPGLWPGDSEPGCCFAAAEWQSAAASNSAQYDPGLQTWDGGYLRYTAQKSPLLAREGKCLPHLPV